MERAMERKTFPAQVTETDGDAGVVDTVFAVFGNIDDGADVVHPGAFTKTFTERGRKVRVLDQHRTDSIMHALGKPLELRELRREDLPVTMQAEYPEATGGAFASVQFLLDTPEGKGAFIRLREGAVDEWSFGYDVLNADFSKATRDGDEITVRNLRELKLYEISPVLWGMNPATATTAAKEKEPEEGKPWRVVPEGGQYCVYKLDAEGEVDGEALECYDTAAEARDYMRALYANEDDADENSDKGQEAEAEEKVGRVLAQRNADRLSQAFAIIADVFDDAGISIPGFDRLIEEIEEESEDADKGQQAGPPAEETPTPDDGAGPSDEAPTDVEKTLAMIELRRKELELLEV